MFYFEDGGGMFLCVHGVSSRNSVNSIYTAVGSADLIQFKLAA
jgi:hypothetical protein